MATLRENLGEIRDVTVMLEEMELERVKLKSTKRNCMLGHKHFQREYKSDFKEEICSTCPVTPEYCSIYNSK